MDIAVGQPVATIFVDCLSTAPFWPTNSLGIVSLLVHRFPFAASAEYLPSGSVSSKLLNGASGTVLNVVLVIPALLMNVAPTMSTVTPSPCNMIVRLGNASPPCDTKITGPCNGTGSSGVC